MIASTTFSISPGFTIPSGLARSEDNLVSFDAIRFSRYGMLSLSSLSLRSNRSRRLTSASRCRFRSSRTPWSHARDSSSIRLCAVRRCLLIACRPSLSNGTSLVSVAYVSALTSVNEMSDSAMRAWSAATPSVRLTRRSMRLETVMYSSALRLTPARVRLKSSSRVGGRESSRPGGKERPVNSSCTEMVACLRQTESSWGSECQLVLSSNKDGTAHGWDGQKHDDHLLLVQDGVADKGIEEPRQTATPFLYKGAVI